MLSMVWEIWLRINKNYKREEEWKCVANEIEEAEIEISQLMNGGVSTRLVVVSFSSIAV